jgi:hypothetical protein
MKANQKATGSAEDAKKNFFLLLQIRFARLNQPNWSETLTRELEENVELLHQLFLNPVL